MLVNLSLIFYKNKYPDNIMKKVSILILLCAPILFAQTIDIGIDNVVDCDRPLGKQITTVGLFVFSGILVGGGLALNKYLNQNSTAENPEDNSSAGAYLLIPVFCYALGGVAFSASIVVEIGNFSPEVTV